MFELDLTFDGTIALEMYAKGPKNTFTRVYEQEARLPDITRVQQFLNEFEVIEKVRNSRDNTETIEKNLSAKRKAKINEGKITQSCHAIATPFCGATLVSVRYRPLYLKDAYTCNDVSPKGFEFLWKHVMEFVKEANILPA